jgi:hypothetical protein
MSSGYSYALVSGVRHETAAPNVAERLKADIPETKAQLNAIDAEDERRSHDSRRYPNGGRARRDVTENYRIRADHRVVADHYGSEDLRASEDEHAIAKRRATRLPVPVDAEGHLLKEMAVATHAGMSGHHDAISMMDDEPATELGTGFDLHARQHAIQGGHHRRRSCVVSAVQTVGEPVESHGVPINRRHSQDSISRRSRRG